MSTLVESHEFSEKRTEIVRWVSLWTPTFPGISTLSTHWKCRRLHVHWIVPCFFATLLCLPVPGVAEQTVVASSASLVVNSTTAWQGESVLMRCVAKPKYAGISKVLWMRRENDGTMRNIYLYNREHPKATGPYKQFIGRISGWLKVVEGTYYLNLTRTIMSDTAEYYCIVTDDNYLDKISPAKQITVNVKHFNHSVRVNESSESFSHCEEVILDSNSEDEEVKITCSVTSSPKPYLVWSVVSGNDKDWMHGPSVENCTAYSTNIYTCTSTTTLKMSALTSKKTQIHCEAKYQTLTHTNNACVTLVYENFSPPSALTSAMTRWPGIVVGVCLLIGVALILIVLVLVCKRRQRRQENEKRLPSSSKPMLGK